MLLLVSTVGVICASRSYEYVYEVRVVTSSNGMTTAGYPFTQKFLSYTSTRILNDLKGISCIGHYIILRLPGTIGLG